MNESEETKIKNEIDDIMDRVKTIMKKVETLDPFKKDSSPDETGGSSVTSQSD